MRALIGSFLVLCFVNWPASAHHYFDEGLGFLHNNALVINHSIMVIFCFDCYCYINHVI